jgi:hypothetical protein
MTTFNIDFFEFSFLVEACIPNRPIARTMFFHDVINKHYYAMEQDERDRLFEWIQKNPSFNPSEHEDSAAFYARYCPDNQYKITSIYMGVENIHYCFKMGEYFYTRIDTSIRDEFITKIEKL